MNRNFKKRNRKLLNRLIWKQRTLRKTWGFRREIREKISNHTEMENRYQLEAFYIKASRSFLNTYFPGYKNLDWHYAYSFVNGIQAPNYIPEDLYFTKIEPGLNSRLLTKSSTDKNSYGLLHPKNHMPKTYLRNIGGQYFDEDYSWISEPEAKDKLSKIPGKCVLKPALNSGKGRNVIVSGASEISTILFHTDRQKYNNSIIQEYILQHPEIQKLYPNALNTMRIITGRHNNEVVTLSSVLRMGRNQLATDNVMSGGVVCGIRADGKVSPYAFDKHMRAFEKHPDTNVKYAGFKIPNFDKACRLCERLHRKYIHFNIISWDVGIRQNGEPVMIELNLGKQEVFFLQIFNGPLFGEHTGYFLNLAKKNRWMYDFHNNTYFDFYG